MKQNLSSAEKAVAHILRTKSIPAARCSSAKAQGNAGNYPYWGAAEYSIRVARAGYPSAVCVSAASSDRRSTRLAERDTREMAEHLGGVVITSIGRLNCGDLIDVWDMLDSAAYRKHAARQTKPATAPTLGERLAKHKLAHMEYQPYGDARDIAVFRREQNAERRHKIWRACGPRIASALELAEVHHDDFGTLYRAKISSQQWEHEYLVKVVNATPEPDGSYKDYFLRVPSDMRTAKQAVAWTFGLTEQEYAPATQS